MNDTRTLNYWPLLMILEDIFVPELVQDVMDTAADSTIETLAGVVDFILMRALRDREVRRN